MKTPHTPHRTPENGFHARPRARGGSRQPRIWLCLLSLLVAAAGCRPKSLPERDYAAYLADPGNGFLKTRMAGAHLKTSAQYIPPAYLAFREMRRSSFPAVPHTYDSLKTACSGNATFYLTIESTGDKLDLRSLLHRNPTDPVQLSAALSRLDMGFPDGLSLTLEGKSYPPGLCVRESAPGLNRKIRFIAVFPVALDKAAANRCTLAWQDAFFQKSAARFEFLLPDIRAVPDIGI